MGSPLDLHGVYVPLITPFTSGGKPALAEVERLAHESLDAGAAGLVALGTTGEPATLEPDERSAVIGTIGAVCRERSAAFIIGAGSNSTKASLSAVEAANAQAGVTALLGVVPYYTRPSETGIVEHFKVLAAASKTPLVIYNIPYRTGRGLGAASLLELARTPNIAGLKQAVGSVDQDTLTLMANKPDDFHVVSGDDPFLYPLLSLGGAGAIAASSHICTAGFVRLVDAALKAEYVMARHISEILLPVCQALFAEPGPSVIKGALYAQGRTSTPNMRLPMTAASPGAIDTAMAAIAAAETSLANLPAA